MSEDSLKTFKKIVINDWYSILNAENQDEIKLGISEIFDSILGQFKNAISYHNDNLAGNNDKNIKNKYKKFKVFSGHDTIIVNMIKNIMDPIYIKENLKKSLEDQNIFNFFIPEFASYILYELYYDEVGKYYFVKIIYNGMELYDGIKTINLTNSVDKFTNEIIFERFNELMLACINKDYLKLQCDLNAE